MIWHRVYVFRGRTGGALYALAFIDSGERVFYCGDALDTSRILGHSDRPNCVVVAGFVVSLRSLALGEEITCDQRVSNGAAAA